MNNLTKKIILYAMLLFCFNNITFAQVKSTTSPLENINKTKQASENLNLLDQTQKDIYPVGNIIDPNVYLVGPNDILSVQILPLDMTPQPLIITAECSMLHPRFGEIMLKGLTLQQVRDSLTSLSSKQKMDSKASVSLMQARKVFVTIRGNVISPGTYILPASYSISTAIKFANQMQSSVSTQGNIDEQSAISRLQEQNKEREKIFSETGISENSSYSSRNIRIIRHSGIAVIADIERADALQDAKYDPFISEGDEIIVPFEEREFPTISIVGEVLRPISIAYKNGDMASHLLKMGKGLTDQADHNNITLFSNNGQTKLSVNNLGDLLNADIPLTPGSVIIVASKQIQPNTGLDIGTISIKGEVNTPNIYIIKKGETTLKEAIKFAGGFTEKAYLPLATIGRRDNSQNERVPLRRKYNEYFQHSIMTQQDTMRFNIVIDMKQSRVSCDFMQLFADSSVESDIILQDGDVIEVPSKPNRVNVFGQVNNPGFIDFTENQTMEWYIEQAGGYATSAAKERARIIRGINRVWVDGRNDDIYVNDGDEIIVPSPRDVPPEMELQKWAAFVSIASVVVTVVSIVWTIIRDRKVYFSD